ncbi:3-keto-5-aminohexanoate cleavage protein [Jannaschia sp. Os4]|uniref:3-keto-5-aminohexanoate cleavage protein n=1 Tax=Jannaschia sp. Os4 TaxID=2807617 RepID=UPI0019399BCF|nr:3-keto-5-aminohexanoate cleavage protein [Jannaschia sp. Os4]MBM2576927.1 3-keto-5-aminohexanoate cleavage protein [Jannaschia sp. Os4]
MARRRPVIVTAALTGAIHTPSMSPHLPVSPGEIVAEGERAAAAGAAILHVHARGLDGRPDQSAEAFAPILPGLKATGAVVNVTTGGSPFMSVEERVGPAARWAPELASLNMGSMNFGLYPMLDRFDPEGWERDHLEGSRDLVFRNTFKDIEHVLETCSANGTRFEFECYDTAHLYNLRHFADRGLVAKPLFVQAVLGLLGGIGTHPDDFGHMRRTAERLFGGDHVFSALGAGAAQMRVAAMSLASQGNVRVGLEDSLWAGPGEMATSSAVQVEQARAMVEAMGMRLATPDEAREMLGLKGADAVNF